MDAKVARFLDEFSRAVFQQWRQQTENENENEMQPSLVFWRDAQRLQTLLEDAAAKLPRGALKAQLARDVASLSRSLAGKLDALLASHKQATVVDKQATISTSLLNEADVERALTLHETERLAGICVIAGDGKEGEDENEESGQLVARVKSLVDEFAAVVARRFEAVNEQRHKCGALAQRVADAVGKLAMNWSKEATSWNVDEDGSAAKQVDIVRAALQTLVQLDALAVIAAPEGQDEVLASPWTGFYRPEHKKADAVDYDAEMARMFAGLVALAVNFPVVRASSDSDSDSDSDATSEEEDNTTRKGSKPVAKGLDAVHMAQVAVQRAVFAAQQRGRKAQLASGIDRTWLIRVLTALSALPKPATFTSEENEDDGLSAEDRRAVLECVGALYAQALASPSTLFEASSDADVLRAVVCVRQATTFMRTQLKQTLPAVSAASAALARVSLPHSFGTWMVEAKRQLRAHSQHEDLRSAVQSLSTAARTAAGSDEAPLPGSVLLSDSAVTLDKLLAMQQSFEAFVAATERDGKRVKRRQTQRPGIVVGDANGKQQLLEPQEQPDALFFMDSAGGEHQQQGKRKRAA